MVSCPLQRFFSKSDSDRFRDARFSDADGNRKRTFRVLGQYCLPVYFIILCEGKLKVPVATSSASSPRVRGAFPYGVRPQRLPGAVVCASPPEFPAWHHFPYGESEAYIFRKKIFTTDKFTSNIKGGIFISIPWLECKFD